MFFRATSWMVQRYPLVELLHPRLPIWELGGYALDALGRHAGQCTVRSWLLDSINVKWKEKLIEPFPEPCLSCPPIDALEHIVIGSIVREMLDLTYSTREKGQSADEEAMARAMTTGLENGAREFSKMLSSSLRSASSLLKNLESNEAFPVKLEFLTESGKKETKKTTTKEKTTVKKSRRKK